MKKILPIVFFLTICFIPDALPYKDKKAILVLSKDAQGDTLGHNFVTGFASWVYKKIKDGIITLYETPLKEREISFATLEGLENSSSTRFSKTNYLFIYELWTSNKKESSFDILGFRFMNDHGEDEIDYGYVDYPEIAEYLKKAYCKPNIDGYYKTSFHQILMNKEFDYDLLYFDNKPIQRFNSNDPEADYRHGLEIMHKAFNPNKTNLNYVEGQQIKLVEYIIKPSDTKYDKNLEDIFNALEEHFEKNRRDLYNVGGPKLYKKFKNTNIIISSCCVKEFWIKKVDNIEYKVISILPRSLGVNFKEPIKFTKRPNAVAQKIKVNGESLQTILLKKDFDYRILKINNIKIDSIKHSLYLQALIESDWNKLTVFVSQKSRANN